MSLIPLFRRGYVKETEVLTDGLKWHAKWRIKLVNPLVILLVQKIQG